jgi:hypothetical protein
MRRLTQFGNVREPRFGNVGCPSSRNQDGMHKTACNLAYLGAGI